MPPPNWPHPPKFLTYVTFNVGMVVYPGQPIPASWSFHSKVLSISSGQIQASFFVMHPQGGKILITNPTVVPIFGGFAIDGAELSSSQHELLVPLDINTARYVYDMRASNMNGGLPILLELELNGIDESGKQTDLTFSRDAGYIVARGAGLSWQWGRGFNADWKSTYQVAGRLANNDPYATLTPTRLDLVELNTSDGSERIIPLNTSGGLSPSSDINVTSNAAQNWRWFESVSFGFDGPVSVDFTYTVDFAFQDQFGNHYPLPGDGRPWYESSGLTVTVSVSQEKRDHQQAAANEYNAALVFTLHATAMAMLAGAAGIADPIAAAVIGAIAAGLSVAAYTSNDQAQKDGAAADDPIEPDYHLKVFSQIYDLPIPESLAKEKSFVNLVRFLKSIHLIQAAEDVIYQTLPRVLGAYLANDRKALGLQIEHCNSTLALLEAEKNNLSKSTLAASKELNGAIFKYEDQLKNVLAKIKNKGIDSKTKEFLLDNGIPNNLVLDAAAFVQGGMHTNTTVQISGKKTSVLAVQIQNIASAKIQTIDSVSTMASTFLAHLKTKT